MFGAFDDGPGYPRTRSLLQALDGAGCEVALWRLRSPWEGARKRAIVRRPWRWPGAAVDLLVARRDARRQLAAALAAHRPDVVLVPYPGHALAGIVRRGFEGPVVLDLFLPAHDTVVEDRGWFRPDSLPARALRALDRRACAAADLVLVDTPEHAARVAATCGVPAERVGWLAVGDPDAPARPAPYRAPEPGAPIDVLFCGTGVPLHGLPFLCAAARRCAGAVRLTVIGGSPAERRALAASPSPHVVLGPEFVPRRELDRALAAAHVVAGVFGASGKAQRVVPFKVVHGLAAGRPVVTGDTPAVRAWLREGEEVLLAPVADEAALEARLRALVADRARLPALAAAARAAYERCFSPAALAGQMRALLARVAERAGPSSAAAPAETAAMVQR